MESTMNRFTFSSNFNQFLQNLLLISNQDIFHLIFLQFSSTLFMETKLRQTAQHLEQQHTYIMIMEQRRNDRRQQLSTSLKMKMMLTHILSQEGETSEKNVFTEKIDMMKFRVKKAQSDLRVKVHLMLIHFLSK